MGPEDLLNVRNGQESKGNAGNIQGSVILLKEMWHEPV
jgi:hypothetical protein